MLSFVKKYIKLIILALLLLLDIIVANTVLGGQYDSLYDNFYEDSKNYKSQEKIDETKQVAPQYDENKANYQDAKDQQSADMFLNYGTDLTGSCTVGLVKETKEISCEDRTEYEYKDVNVSQRKVLDSINFAEDTTTEIVTKYYCDITNQTYDSQSQCNSECSDTQSTQTEYVCTQGTYNSYTDKCEQPADTTTTYQGCSVINYWDTPSNAYTLDFYEDSSLFYHVAYGDFSLSLESGETYTTSGSYGITTYHSNNSNLTNYIYEVKSVTSDGSTTITTYTFNRNTCELTFNHNIPSDAIFGSDYHLILHPGESKVYGEDFLPITIENTSTLTTVKTCPSETVLSGDKCISNPDISYECPTGYTLINSNICLKTESCSDMPTTEETTVYNAKFAYYLDPSSFEPLVNCALGQFSCVDWRNTCITKNQTQDCIEYNNICWKYTRSGTCQKKIEHIYTECDYNITSEPVN